ncbi:MAG TPA: transglutaminase domain-containing protein [Vitreimonas sp.]|nr:transglutaminase domain-containing protein [Vitreimonas sp.]
MKIWLRLLVALVVGWVGLFFQPAYVLADENFYTALHTTYEVNASGQTQVTHRFRITNKTPSFFIKQYALTIGSSSQVAEIIATSDGKNIPLTIERDKNSTSITLNFPDQVVGEGKIREFFVTYENNDASLVSGKVLEVHVPQLSQEKLYDEYRVVLITPFAFGEPVRVNPAEYEITTQPGQIVTTFPNLTHQAISALYGQEQIFHATLRYNLENTGSFPGLMQVALPPDTPFQRVYYRHLDPLPQSFERDVDGNWIATYRLPPNSQTTVHAQVETLLSLTPFADVPVTAPTDTFIKTDEYWPLSSPRITDLSQTLGDVSSIYQYVVKNLTYINLEPGQVPERLGATGALDNPTLATCQEFTDLFVTLARAKNIPARRLTGYAYTQNNELRPLSLVEDILHAWPEYYDYQRQAWVAVDPTWENTTGGIDYFNQFDLNHIVFAINGHSSSLPYPAGAYKFTDQNTKDVEVAFGESFTDVPLQFTIELQPQTLATIPVPGRYNLIVRNDTGRAWYDLNLHTQAELQPVELQPNGLTLPAVLPYEQKVIPLQVFNLRWRSEPTIITNTLALAGTSENVLTFTHHVNSGPFYFQLPYLIGLGGSGIFFTLLAGSVLVYRRAR